MIRKASAVVYVGALFVLIFVAGAFYAVALTPANLDIYKSLEDIQNFVSPPGGGRFCTST